MGEGQDADHVEAWERYMEAERRELENRRNGLLRKLLGGPLPGEFSEELERLASEDEARAEEGLVELNSPDGEVYYKHIDAHRRPLSGGSLGQSSRRRGAGDVDYRANAYQRLPLSFQESEVLGNPLNRDNPPLLEGSFAGIYARTGIKGF